MKDNASLYDRDLEDRIVQKALSFERPFSLAEVTVDQASATTYAVLKRLCDNGDLRITSTNDLRARYLTKYEWVN